MPKSKKSDSRSRQTCGDNLGVSGSRRKPYSRRSKAEGAVPEQRVIGGQKRLIPSCGEEVVSKKQLENGSLQTQRHKSCSGASKAAHIKRTWKVRAEKFYTRGELLGRGGFGSVYAGTRKSDGLPVALKYAKKVEDDEIQLPGLDRPLPREVGLLMTVNSPPHPNVLRLHDWFSGRGSYVMVTERPAPCQDLAEFCERQGGALGEGVARLITRQLLGALQHCRGRGVAHRDVKPQNILVQTDTLHIKLIDFGCADPLRDAPYAEFSGTESYLPPEWFEEQQFQAGPGTVWSVGVTLFQVLSGALPFSTLTSRAMQQVHLPEGLSPGLRDFLSCCLRPRAEDRPTLGQLQLHPWLHQ